MKVVFIQGSRKSFNELDYESQQAVKNAMSLVENKTGFKTHSEAWRNCQLEVIMGHNIYTTSINICPPQKELIKRSNWHNGHAYFCNGVFWANWGRTKVELI